MATEGGAMRGYCSTGRRRIESPPISMMVRARTQAKTGRSMKNLDMGRGSGQGWAEGGAPGVWATAAGVGTTSAPGRTFCNPSTTT